VNKLFGIHIIQRVCVYWEIALSGYCIEKIRINTFSFFTISSIILKSSFGICDNYDLYPSQDSTNSGAVGNFTSGWDNRIRSFLHFGFIDRLLFDAVERGTAYRAEKFSQRKLGRMRTLEKGHETSSQTNAKAPALGLE
jgi:hypothetical protein